MSVARAVSLLCAFLILAVALPINAQSPAPPANATNAFDGTYVGVSAENTSSANTRRRARPYWGLRRGGSVHNVSRSGAVDDYQWPRTGHVGRSRARGQCGSRRIPDYDHRIRPKFRWPDRGPADQGSARRVLRVYLDMAEAGLIETGSAFAAKRETRPIRVTAARRRRCLRLSYRRHRRPRRKACR